MHIIGVAAQAQNGKDTLSDYLQDALNVDGVISEPYWERGAFAKAVKRIFMDAFDKDAAYIEKWKVIPEIPPDLDLPVRAALQFIGDGFRTIKGSIWIDIALRNKTPQIISDCRYVNELKAIHENGGFNILMVRPDMINDDPNGSEAQMRPFADYVMHLASQRGGRYRKAYLASAIPATWEGGNYGYPRLPEGWKYLHYVVINNGTLEDLYQTVDENLVDAINIHFKGK
jgi:hypothetical protein